MNARLALVVPLLCLLLLPQQPASAAVYPDELRQSGSHVRFFDAHNHITGILPYAAFANLPSFVKAFADPGTVVTQADRLAYFTYLADVWYPAQKATLDDKLFSPPDGQRYSLGGRAALVVYRDRAGERLDVLNGALERILTATPWSEFDSAYAFRGGPTEAYMSAKVYGGDTSAMAADLCRATVLQLAKTQIAVSEQSINFIGGWQTKSGQSARWNALRCYMNAAGDASIERGLAKMGKRLPIVKFLLMTHTAQLATLGDPAKYSEWSKTGTCEAAPLPPALTTTPKTVYDGLMGNDGAAAIVPSELRPAFFDTVVGIDTAGPETTCFSVEGMRYYVALAQAVYDAAKARRALGWHGKLLIHTHVGEGSAIYFAPTPPAQPWTFENVFAHLPAERSNAAQASANISRLLAAIASLRSAHPDLQDFVVFRLAHDTWATPEQAQAMHDERVEADVNLESNVATGAYPIARMPLSTTTVMQQYVNPLIGDVGSNFAIDNLLGVLVDAPTDDVAVGEILGNASLKYLLEKHVRCLMGTDGEGVEHSDIVKEYQFADALTGYWRANDPQFATLSGNAGADTLFENVRLHFDDMSTDRRVPYQ